MTPQRCCLCRQRGHYYGSCPKRSAAGTKPCRICCGLPHRRDPRGCHGCDKPFAMDQFGPAETQHESPIAELETC